MNYLLSALSISVYLFLTACGVSQKHEEVTTSLLWKIEKDDLKHPTYLYGTMHLIEEEFYFFPESLKKLVIGSKRLVMELEGLPNQAEAMKMMFLPEGQKLSDFFTEEEMNAVYAYMEAEMKLTKEAFDLSFGRMKPFIILQLITANQFKNATQSYEMELSRLAEEHKIELKGLETIEQQLGFFDEIPLGDFGSLLGEYLTQGEEMAKQTREMQRIYRKGDLDSLMVFMTESAPELMKYDDLLLNNRNKAWIPLIEKWIYEKPTFIAVGAAHLVGEQGVIQLLRNKGYKVTAIAY
jgi:uncharacterized protein